MLVWIGPLGKGWWERTWILGHELSCWHASSHLEEIPDLVQGAAGAADDGCYAAGLCEGGEDGAGGVSLGGGGEDVCCS